MKAASVLLVCACCALSSPEHARAQTAPTGPLAPIEAQQHTRPPELFAEPPRAATGVVREIAFTGQRRIPASTLRARVETREGEALSAEKLERDVRALMAAGWLERVRVEMEVMGAEILNLRFGISQEEEAKHFTEGTEAPRTQRSETRMMLRVRFVVEEKPFLAGVEFRGSQALREERIRTLLEENGMAPQTARFVDQTRLWKAARVIEQELAERGQLRGQVRVRLVDAEEGSEKGKREKGKAEGASGAAMRAVFEISDGPRVEVEEVRFEGNRGISDAELRAQMKAIVPWAWFAGLRAKNIFTTARASTDRARVEGYYRERGYAEARVGEAQVVELERQEMNSGEQKSARSAAGIHQLQDSTEDAEVQRTQRRDTAGLVRVRMTIPVEEGPQYSLAEVTAEGGHADHAEQIARVLAAFRSGERYAADKLERARAALADLRWPVEMPERNEEEAVNPLLQLPDGAARKSKRNNADTRPHFLRGDAELAEARDRERRTVRATLRLREPEAWTLGRIEFRGHKRFGEAYYRRRILVREGELLDPERLERGLEQLARDGFVKRVEARDIALSFDAATRTANLRIRVEEIGRQRASLVGGAAGATSTLGLAYQVFNLLGGEELLTTHFEAGPEKMQALLGLAKEGLFGTRVSLGLNLLHTALRPRLGGGESRRLFTTRASGLSATTAYTLTETSTVGVHYELAKTETRLNLNFPEGLVGVAGGGLNLTRTRSTLGASWEHTAHSGPEKNPDSTAGAGSARRMLANLALSGTGLGGDEDTLRATMESAGLRRDPLTRGRNAWAARGLLTGIGSTTGRTVPLDARLFAGEELVRGLRGGELAPVEETTAADGTQRARTAGANIVAAFNLEYRMPLAPAVPGAETAAFFDTGAGWLLPRWLGGTRPSVVEGTNGPWRASAGLEIRFTIPKLEQTVRVYAAWNPLRLAKALVLRDGGVFRAAGRKAAVGWAVGTLF